MKIFLNQLAHSFIKSFNNPIEESKSGVDDRLYRESLTRVLEWMNILTDTENFSKQLVQPIVTDIFNCYLQAQRMGYQKANKK